MKKNQKSDVFINFGSKKIADEKKDDFMDTHQNISECLTNLVFFQIARKCDNSSRDLNRDLKMNLKPPTYYYDGLAEQPSDIRWLRGPRMSFFTKYPGFRYLFRFFQQQMFLAHNMIHQLFKARLKLALTCYVKFMRSPLFSPSNSSHRRFLSQCCNAFGFTS